MFLVQPSSPASSGCFPRASGDVPYATGKMRATAWFSPRERGCSHLDAERCVVGDVFPARAGMFRRVRRSAAGTCRFPRASGDVPVTEDSAGNIIVFSPRERGCSQEKLVGLERRNVFPARAGMFLCGHGSPFGIRCFPRASGDVPNSAAVAPVVVPFSPRERGCSGAQHLLVVGDIVFPARAGMFPKTRRSGCGRSGFPRASGVVQV